MNKKNVNNNYIKSEKGITIVALTVTIIIILILASITINIAIDDEGLFNYSKEFANQQKNLVNISTEEINNLRDNLNDTVDIGESTTILAESITLDKTQANLLEGNNVRLTANVFPTYTNNKAVTWTSSDTSVATVEGNGVVKGVSTGKTTIIARVNDGSGKTTSCEVIVVPATWDLAKVKPVESSDGVIVPVPNGFTASSVSIQDGFVENTVAGGFVIYENTESGNQKVTNENYELAQTSRNQFVWVPVDLENTPMFTNVTDSNGNTITVGQLYNFQSIINGKPDKYEYVAGSYREPDILKDKTAGDASLDENEGISLLKAVIGLSGTTGDEILAKWEQQLKDEFNEMKQSVLTYGGFYIGRYETGNLKADAKSVVVRENSDINEVSWYTIYQKSKNIIQNSTPTDVGIKTSMIWGCQWDATMNWFLSNSSTARYVTEGTGKGNYSGTNGNVAIATGKAGYDINNIYDMAGNVNDWTLEANYYSTRILRGGSYNASASNSSASFRGQGSQPHNSSSKTYGSRSTLII